LSTGSNPIPRSPVGLISNPGSGHNRDQFEQIRARIAQCDAIHHLVTDSPADIKPALAELARRQVGVLAINGGDGTASAVLGEMLESGVFATLPKIVLLPGGTANMNAGDIGISGSLAAATAKFCQWCDAGPEGDARLAQRALLRVVTGDNEPPRYGMFLGGGAIIQGTEYAHKEVHSRGLRDDFSMALTTLRTVWGVLRDDPAFNRHVAVKLSLDGDNAASHDTLILAISTLHRLAFGMRPFWGSGPGNIRLTLIEQHCSRFACTFFSIVRGRPNRNAVPQSGYFSHNADSIRVELDGKLNLDGEILVANGTVNISASPLLEFLNL
jgi:diacylglycerol kinase (ATP)